MISDVCAAALREGDYIVVGGRNIFISQGEIYEGAILLIVGTGISPVGGKGRYPCLRVGGFN